ncbi:hypothetical protein EV177_009067, partial [Coemansia sp. RSA 1804]
DEINSTRRSLRAQQPRYLDSSLTGNEVFEFLDEYIVDEEGVGCARRRRRRKKRAKKSQHQSKRQKTSADFVDNNQGGASMTDTLDDNVGRIAEISDENSLGSNSQQMGVRKAASAYRPRWYNQMYLMFLALRQSPGFTASRSELVRKAVELDQRISRERGLPRAFTGKTPQNSASALLTNNGDGHFIQFRPPGARCYHFKLAYNPGDFESALSAYNEWMAILVEKDWPLCFGTPQPETENDENPTLNYDNVPKSWRDIVEVKPSTIPNAGDGLFAVRDLPAGVPLGFYFGVPMTEDEFDSLKEKIGMASHYSIMYRRTVLDATDDSGMPFGDPEGLLYCPFHFMNEARSEQENGDQKSNIVFLEGIKVNQVICLTLRDIAKGEEIFVSYGDEVDRSHWGSVSSDNPDGSVRDDVFGSEAGENKQNIVPTVPIHRAGAIRAAPSASVVAEACSGNGHMFPCTDDEKAAVSHKGFSRRLQTLLMPVDNVETDEAIADPVSNVSKSPVLAPKDNSQFEMNDEN